MKTLGIDIGGTGIKGAVVDTNRGVLKTDRLRILTPHPATPDAVTEVVERVVEHFEWEGPIGCTFPGVVRDGTVHTAANLDPAWIGHKATSVVTAAARSEHTAVVLNDADAAGIAEVAFGAGRKRSGVVLVVTLGTGIGSALFVDGELVPNAELGHLPLEGGAAERYAAESVRETEGLSWEDWAGRVSEYLNLVENLLWPDLIVLGGGVSKQADRFLPLLSVRTEVVAAELRNRAGIVGAALEARKTHEAGSTKKSKRKR